MSDEPKWGPWTITLVGTKAIDPRLAARLTNIPPPPPGSKQWRKELWWEVRHWAVLIGLSLLQAIAITLMLWGFAQMIGAAS